MRILRHPPDIQTDLRGGWIAVGNFDGVHRGHQAVIGAARAAGRAAGVPAGVLTFEPHPRAVFDPALPPFRLTPWRIKARAIEALGLDFLVIQHFDRDFAAHSAREFVEWLLVGRIGAAGVVVGSDFVFGRGREGDVGLLERLGAEHGVAVRVQPPVASADGLVYSSTRVRDALTSGDPREAARVLGRHWEIEGRVETGDARGRTIGFPTANIRIHEFLHPATGVYAVRAGIDAGEATTWHDGVANFGRRPTFGLPEPLLEVHLFDYSGDLYGRHLRVALVDYLRPERRFAGLAELQEQIGRDSAAARKALAQQTIEG